jgi:hypothetical protein
MCPSRDTARRLCGQCSIGAERPPGWPCCAVSRLTCEPHALGIGKFAGEKAFNVLPPVGAFGVTLTGSAAGGIIILRDSSINGSLCQRMALASERVSEPRSVVFLRLIWSPSHAPSGYRGFARSCGPQRHRQSGDAPPCCPRPPSTARPNGSRTWTRGARGMHPLNGGIMQRHAQNSSESASRGMDAHAFQLLRTNASSAFFNECYDPAAQPPIC